MDIEDISPAAVLLGLVGALIVIVMMSITHNSEGVSIGLFWRVLAPIATFVACFFLVNRMAE
jgi:hypothetical protein